jgi:hypothetical protein
MIRITAKDPANVGPVWMSNVVSVRLDGAAPTGGASTPAACHHFWWWELRDFTIGDVISGSYEVADEHFGAHSRSNRLSAAASPVRRRCPPGQPCP